MIGAAYSQSVQSSNISGFYVVLQPVDWVANVSNGLVTALFECIPYNNSGNLFDIDFVWSTSNPDIEIKTSLISNKRTVEVSGFNENISGTLTCEATDNILMLTSVASSNINLTFG